MFGAKARIRVIYLIVFVSFLLLGIKVFSLQVIKGETYTKLSDNKITMNLVEKAPRGEIFDRYGKLLVGNEPAYSLNILKTDIDDEELNETILKLVKLLEQYGADSSNLPTIDNEEIESLASKYYISSAYSSEDQRKIIEVRYDMEKSGFSALSPYELTGDAPLEVVSIVKESSDKFSGVAVTNSYKRKYYNDGYAAHILGRIGKMDKEEYESLKDSGYNLSESVGKQGIEKSLESYLHGTDGIKENSVSDNLLEKRPAVSGDNVILTIDMELQRALEDSLKVRINKISNEGGEKSGRDANAGAGVVIDVKSGEILAIASYPTYDIESFNKNYSSLSTDENKPLWNRAVSGTYTPGSTFKPLVAIAALETGNIKVNEKITDDGIYTFYEDYRPRCWIWSEYNTTHGSINVSQAIEKSCNYFFYETGRRTGIDKIDEYGTKFGLGKKTGVELPEEVKGYIASPEAKKNTFKNASEQGWYGADTLQAAIGQSIHSFTPIQIANYIATIANGGYRYNASLVKSIRISSTGEDAAVTNPEVAEIIEMKPENLNAVRLGMKNVVEEGSARAIFTGYPIEIGGKTGTAQVGTKVSNNALFAAFAPFDNPEIAVCIVIEHGVRGANAAYVAKDVFDKYFGLNAEAVASFSEYR